MPSGRTHDLIGVAASPILAITATATLGLEYHQPALQALMGGLILAGSHLACTNWLSPDLDLGSSEIAGRWGRLRFIWEPYDRFVPHRHWLSHSGFSAILRLLYLFVALNLICITIALLMVIMTFLIGLFISGTASGREVVIWLLAQYLALGTLGFELVERFPIETGLLLLGAFISDLLHTVADLISTWVKRRRYRKLIAALPPIIRSRRKRAHVLGALRALRWPPQSARSRRRNYRTSR